MKSISLLWITVLCSRAVLSAPAGSEEIKLLPSEDKAKQIQSDEYNKESAGLDVLVVKHNSKDKASDLESSDSEEIKLSPSEAKAQEMPTHEHNEDEKIKVADSSDQNTELKASTVEKNSEKETQISKVNSEVKYMDEESNTKAVDDASMKIHLDNAQSEVPSAEDINNIKTPISSNQDSNKFNSLPNESNKVEISAAKVKNQDAATKLKDSLTSMFAIPEIATNLKLIDDTKNDIEVSLRKVKESQKDAKPVSLADDHTKAQFTVSTGSRFPRPIEAIKEFANLAGTFVTSLLQVPIILLTSLKDVITRLSLSLKPQTDLETFEITTTSVI